MRKRDTTILSLHNDKAEDWLTELPEEILEQAKYFHIQPHLALGSEFGRSLFKFKVPLGLRTYRNHLNSSVNLLFGCPREKVDEASHAKRKLCSAESFLGCASAKHTIRCVAVLARNVGKASLT